MAGMIIDSLIGCLYSDDVMLLNQLPHSAQTQMCLCIIARDCCECTIVITAAEGPHVADCYLSASGGYCKQLYIDAV